MFVAPVVFLLDGAASGPTGGLRAASRPWSTEQTVTRLRTGHGALMANTPSSVGLHSPPPAAGVGSDVGSFCLRPCEENWAFLPPPSLGLLSPPEAELFATLPRRCRTRKGEPAGPETLAAEGSVCWEARSGASIAEKVTEAGVPWSEAAGKTTLEEVGYEQGQADGMGRISSQGQRWEGAKRANLGSATLDDRSLLATKRGFAVLHQTPAAGGRGRQTGSALPGRYVVTPLDGGDSRRHSV